MPSGDALWMITTSGAPAYGADEMRQLESMGWYPGDNPLGARPGVRPGHTPVSLAGQTVTVAACGGIVAPAANPWTAASGTYRWALASGDHTLTPADGTNDRIDRLVLAIEDHDIDSSGQRRATTFLKTGVPAAVPVAPDVDPGELSLATIDVASGGSPAPTLTLSGEYTVALGGILPVATRADLPDSGLYDGAAAFIVDEQVLVVCQGGTWVGVGNRKGYQLWQTIYFTSSGSFTKASYAGLKGVRVRCQGGGGGGGGTNTTAADEASSSGGGGGGCYAERFVAASALAASVTVTVGAGGTAGAASSVGGAGGTSSFGSHCIAPGGSGGFNRSPSTGFRASSGGASTGGGTGDLVIPGGGGGAGFSFGTSVISAVTEDKGVYGAGGSSFLGNTGRGARGPSTSPAAGPSYGSGGSGNVNDNSEAGKTGAAGGPGVVIVDLFV